MKNTLLIISFAFILKNSHAQEKPPKGVKSTDSLVQVINSKKYSKFYPKEFNEPARSYDDSTVFYIDTLSHDLRKITHKRMQHTAYRDTRVEVFYYSSTNGIHLVRIDYEFFNDCMAAIGTWYVNNNKVVQTDRYSNQESFNYYLKMSNGYIDSFENTFYKKGTNNSKR